MKPSVTLCHVALLFLAFCTPAFGGRITPDEVPSGVAVEDFTVFRASNPPEGGVPFTLGNLTFFDVTADAGSHQWHVFEQGTTILFPVGEILGDNHAFSHLRIVFGKPVTLAGLDVGFFGEGSYEVTFFDRSDVALGVVHGTNVPFTQ